MNVLISEKYLRDVLNELRCYVNELDDAKSYCNEEDAASIEKHIGEIGELWKLGNRYIAASKHGRVVKGQLAE